MQAIDAARNELVRAGIDEAAAPVVTGAVCQWLRWRAEQLRAEGRYADASWFLRVASELRYSYSA